MRRKAISKTEKLAVAIMKSGNPWAATDAMKFVNCTRHQAWSLLDKIEKANKYKTKKVIGGLIVESIDGYDKKGKKAVPAKEKAFCFAWSSNPVTGSAVNHG